MEIVLSPQTEEAVLNINKPPGMTSFDVVRRVRKRFCLKKVGHAGTLDPFATGVLLILVGRATKRFDEFARFDKEYLAELEFGVETDTHDIQGKVIQKTKPVPRLSEQKIKAVLKKYRGEIEQIPPAFSAVKYKGRPLYRYARKNIAVEVRPRKVVISEMELLENRWPRVKLRIVCSKGTYIRSLARDIGRDLGVGAFVRELVRIRVGPYRLEEAVGLEELLEQSAR